MMGASLCIKFAAIIFRSHHVFSRKKGVIVGIADDQSIAYGCVQAFRAAGAKLAIT